MAPARTSDLLDLDAVGEEAKPACTFKLADRVWRCRQQGDIAWGAMQPIMSATTDTPGAARVAIQDFFRAVLHPDEVSDFMEVLADPTSRLTVTKVNLLVDHISTKVFGRPTQPPAPSRSARRSTGRTSQGS